MIQAFRRTLISTLLFALLAGVALAQPESSDVDVKDLLSEFGSIPIEYLNMEADHDYPFEYLSKRSAIRFIDDDGGIRAVIDHLVRIKVYSNDPIEIAEASMVGIPYYQADDMEEVRNIEGFTYLPDGSTYQLSDDHVSESELNKRYSIVEFEMPEVAAGAVLEYKYTVNRRYIEELPDFYFSHQVPTRRASVSLQNERFLRYEAVTQQEDFEISYSREEVDTSQVPLVFSYSRPEPILIERWEAEDIPAVDHTTYISSVDDIRGKVKFMISEFGIPRQPLENSWELVAAQINRNASPDRKIEQNRELQKKGEEIAGLFGSAAAAQDSIFQYINETVIYNGMNAVFIDDGLYHVLNGEPANQAEINMVLLAMLRGAGIESYPLYISGRDFGRVNQAFPSLYQFNKMLVKSVIDDRNYVMDASFRFSQPDLIPVESFNEQGFVLKSSGYEWIDIAPDKSVFDLTIFLDLDLSESGDLSGTLRASMAGYPAQQLLSQLQSDETERSVAVSTFLDVYSDALVDRVEIRRSEGVNRQLAVEIDFEIENYAISFSDGLEFRPMVVGYLFQNPFESTERRVPITLDAPEKLMINYSLSLPEGFGKDQADEAIQTRLFGAELNERYSSTGGILQYSFEIDITRKEFPADMYSDLRRLYERWVDLSNSTWFIEGNVQ